jgi:hypothetical protein
MSNYSYTEIREALAVLVGQVAVEDIDWDALGYNVYTRAFELAPKPSLKDARDKALDILAECVTVITYRYTKI